VVEEPVTRAICTIALLGVLAIAGCGGSDGDAESTSAPQASVESEVPDTTAAVPPEPSAEDPAAGEAGAEASPEAPAQDAGEVSELPDLEEQAVSAAFENYIRRINVGDALGVCAAFAPGGLPLQELPVDRGSCASSVRGSLGSKPGGGGPAWRRTRIVDITAVSVGEGQARVTATVVHRFADRDYSSVEEDVTYLREIDERWAVAQPSATLYRAVGYPEPPLRAFTPPP
jgi:hypothetical protein